MKQISKINWLNVSFIILTGLVGITGTILFIVFGLVHWPTWVLAGAIITLSKRIEAHVPSHAPLIIAGDFNDWRRGAFNYMEKELELKEVYKVLEGKHAKTYPASRPTLEVDRIYYRGLKLLSGEIFNESYWKKLSDHLPLHAKFAIE